MTARIIRMQCLSLNAAGGRPYENILLYIKRLTAIRTSDGTVERLDETDPDSSLVFSFNEAYDIPPDNQFFQILFLQSGHETKVINDIVFYRAYLSDILECWVKIRDIQQQLITYASLDHKATLAFSLQFVDNIPQKNLISREGLGRHSIRGHSMIFTQFHHATRCAICTNVISERQGYRCEYCLVTTDRQCHERIPFVCQIFSPDRAFSFPDYLSRENPSDHVFEPHKVHFYQNNHSCRNCGEQISRNAFKCQQCKFFVHDKCRGSVPSFCGQSYQANCYQYEVENPVGWEKSIRISLMTLSTPLSPLGSDGLQYLPKLSDFEYIGHLGDGGNSHVYCVRHIPSMEYMAIKVVDGTNESARKQFEMERQILFRFSEGSPFMIKGYCSFHQGTNLFLVMEFVGDDCILHRMQRRPMNENEIRFYLAEIISVIKYLHYKQVIYRDLKLEHILVCPEGHIRLIDLGLGRIFTGPNADCDTVCGTLFYVAPEVRHLSPDPTAGGYSYPVDYWAIGKMFMEMLCGEPICSLSDDHSDPADDLPNYRHISAEARSLARGLLETDPKRRLGSEESPHGKIEEHPFFQMGKGTNWPEVHEGIAKPINSKPPLQPIDSGPCNDFPYPIISLNRGPFQKRDWIKAGESICENADQEKIFQVYDHVNFSLWKAFLKEKKTDPEN